MSQLAILTLVVVALSLLLAFAFSDPPDFTGYYLIKGKPAAEFADIAWVDLERGTDTSGKWQLNGCVRLRKQENGRWVRLKFETQSLAESHVAFETEAYEGVSYKLDADFLMTDLSEAEKGEPAVLMGVLVKLNKGKVVAKKSLQFSFSNGE